MTGQDLTTADYLIILNPHCYCCSRGPEAQDPSNFALTANETSESFQMEHQLE
jgi:hypothetical protein